MPEPDATVELRSGDVRVTIALAHGGRVAQITVGSQALLCDDRSSGPIGWGSYPMAPWAGRLRGGRFTFEGVTHQLELNHTDDDGARHAIHGTVFDAAWTLDSVPTPTSSSLRCALDASLGWPLGGLARQSITLTDDALTCELSVESDDGSFPASIGWHPWFVKPDRLVIRPEGMFERNGIGLPLDRLVPPAPHPWDDTFRNVEPVELCYDTGPDVGTVTVTSDCDHWVVYDHPPHATCVEPQSGPPDALNVAPFIITPGQPLHRWMRIAWSR